MLSEMEQEIDTYLYTCLCMQYIDTTHIRTRCTDTHKDAGTTVDGQNMTKSCITHYKEYTIIPIV